MRTRHALLARSVAAAAVLAVTAGCSTTEQGTTTPDPSDPTDPSAAADPSDPTDPSAAADPSDPTDPSDPSAADELNPIEVEETDEVPDEIAAVLTVPDGFTAREVTRTALGGEGGMASIGVSGPLDEPDDLDRWVDEFAASLVEDGWGQVQVHRDEPDEAADTPMIAVTALGDDGADLYAPVLAGGDHLDLLISVIVPAGS